MNEYNNPGNRLLKSEKSDLQIEFEAIGKALMICIQACRCPSCNAPPYKICLTDSNKKRSHHLKRIIAGHKLIVTSPAELLDRIITQRLKCKD